MSNSALHCPPEAHFDTTSFSPISIAEAPNLAAKYSSSPSFDATQKPTTAQQPQSPSSFLSSPTQYFKKAAQSLKSIQMPSLNLGTDSIFSSRSNSPTNFSEDQSRSRSSSTASVDSQSTSRSSSGNPSASSNLISRALSPIQAIFKNEVTPKIDSMINSWLDENNNMTSNMYVQGNLEDAITDSIFQTNKTTQARELIDPRTDLSKVEKALKDLLEKYKINEDVTPVLQNALDTLSAYQKAQTNIPQQTNIVIAPFYTPEVKLSILKIMNIKPDIDPVTGVIKNMPSIEMIQEAATKNPTQATFDTLNAAIKAIRIAKSILKQDSSLIPSSYNPLMKSNVTDKLQAFDQDLNSALTNPLFDQYKNFALKNILDNTGLHNLTISSAIDNLRSGMKGATYVADQITQFKNDDFLNNSGYVVSAAGGYARMGVSGAIIDTLLYHYGKDQIPAMINKLNTMTIAQLLDGINPSEKTSILAAHATMEDMISANITFMGEVNKMIKGSNAHQIAQARMDANNAIANSYYQPKLQQAVFKLMNLQPQFDPATGALKNMASIDDILKKATENPSQDSYDALKAVLKATDAAIYAAKYSEVALLMGDSLKVKQLYLYKESLTDALENPDIIKYKSKVNRAANFVASKLPTATDMINATGIMDTTLDTALNSPKATTAINYALNNTKTGQAVGQTTIGQILTTAEALPTPYKKAAVTT